jgi:hypothetical protein
VDRLLSSHKLATSYPPLTAKASQNDSTLGDKFVHNNQWASNDKRINLGPPTDSLGYQEYDLEGIADDGYGYTVRISAESFTSGSDESSGVEEKRIRKTKLGKAEVDNIYEDSTKHKKRTLPWMIHNVTTYLRSDLPCPPKEDHLTIEVVTRQSVEVRESFHEADEGHPYHGWDVHKAHPIGTSYEEDGNKDVFLTTALI